MHEPVPIPQLVHEALFPKIKSLFFPPAIESTQPAYHKESSLVSEVVRYLDVNSEKKDETARNR